MKTIDNYILERLNPRHLGKSKFPIDGTYKKVVDFLKEHGFERVDIHDDKLDETCLVFNKEHKKCFYQDRESAGIMFADTTREEISENNPLYYMYLIDSKNNTWLYHRWCGIEDPIAVISRDVFEKEINELFDW